MPGHRKGESVEANLFFPFSTISSISNLNIRIAYIVMIQFRCTYF